MSFRESVVPYLWSMGVAVGGYFLAGWILTNHGMSAPILPGIFAAITLGFFNKKVGWIQAIVLTIFVLACSLKYQSDYLEQSSLFVGFRASILEGFKVLWNKLLPQEIVLHLFGAFFVFMEASPFHFSGLRAKMQKIPVVPEAPSLKRTLLPYFFGIGGTLLGGILFMAASTHMGLYAPMLPGLFACVALSCVLKREDRIRPFFLSIFVLSASIYIQFTYVSNPRPLNLMDGLTNITRYLTVVDMVLHAIGPIFVFTEAQHVSPQFS